MIFPRRRRKASIPQLLLLTAVAAGCGRFQAETKASPTTIAPASSRSLPASTLPATVAGLPTKTNGLSLYAFPASIDSQSHYLFYLPGKILEDQGIPAISPEFGEYEIEAILEKLSSYGFVVISEQRPKDADSLLYARKTAQQVQRLLEAGVPAKNITVVGASKGGYIAIRASNLLKNKEINFVILAICNPEVLKDLEYNQVFLYGNVLSIYDSVDKYGGSCQRLFSLSKDKGLNRYDEAELEVGMGHGLLYKPLDAWIVPTMEWAK